MSPSDAPQIIHTWLPLPSYSPPISTSASTTPGKRSGVAATPSDGWARMPPLPPEASDADITREVTCFGLVGGHDQSVTYSIFTAMPLATTAILFPVRVA